MLKSETTYGSDDCSKKLITRLVRLLCVDATSLAEPAKKERNRTNTARGGRISQTIPDNVSIFYGCFISIKQIVPIFFIKEPFEPSLVRVTCVA